MPLACSPRATAGRLRKPARCRPLLPLLLLTAVVVALGSTPAWAAVTVRALAANVSYATASLPAPTGLTFTKNCSALTASTVTLKWTATTSTYANGYLVTSTKNGSSSGTTPQTVTGRTTTSTTYPISNGVSYSFTVAATYRSWSSLSNPATGAVSC